MTSRTHVRTKTDENFEQALWLQQRGMIDRAEQIYIRIVRVHSKHFGALNYLGVINFHRNNYTKALHLIGKAIAEGSA
jgi:hypothetical protein